MVLSWEAFRGRPQLGTRLLRRTSWGAECPADPSKAQPSPGQELSTLPCRELCPGRGKAQRCLPPDTPVLAMQHPPASSQTRVPCGDLPECQP